jgi:hypothetical protein
MSWAGGNSAPPSWMGKIDGNADVGNLVVSPNPPNTTLNPSLTLEGRNTIPFPTSYASMNIGDLTVTSINGATGPIGPDLWSLYPAIHDVRANLDDSGNPQYNLSQFKNLYCSNVYATLGGILGGVVDGNGAQFDHGYFSSYVNVGLESVGGASLNVYGGTVLDGGTFHGTTIGSLPFEGVNTTRVDVLPIGIDVVSATYVTIDAGAGANIAAGGSVSIAGGSFVEVNSGEVDFNNSTDGNDASIIKVGNITSASYGSQPLRIGGGNGVKLTQGVDVQSDVFRATNVLQAQVCEIYGTWNANTQYTAGQILNYSATSTALGRGSRYTCMLAGSGAIPADLFAPTWISGEPYVVGNLVQYNTLTTFMVYRCAVNVDSATTPDDDPFHWTPTLFASTRQVWELLGDQLYNQIYFEPPTDVFATSYWSLLAPAGTLGGICIAQHDNATNDFLGIGQFYDSFFNPPPWNPTATNNLNMNGYSITNAHDVMVDSLTASTAEIVLNSDIEAQGQSLLDINYVRLLGVLGSDPTIRFYELGAHLGLSMGLLTSSINSYIIAEAALGITATAGLTLSGSSNTITGGDTSFATHAVSGITTLTCNTIEGTPGNPLYIGSGLNMNYHTITNCQNLATDGIQAYASSNLNVNSPIAMGTNTILTNSLGLYSGSAMTINCDLTSTHNQTTGTLSANTIQGLPSAQLHIGSGMNMDFNTITNCQNIATNGIQSYSSSHLSVNSSINMGLNTILTNSIQQYSGTEIAVNCDLNMEGYSLLNVGNISSDTTATFSTIKVDTIEENAGSYVQFASVVDMGANNIQNCNTIAVDFLTPNLASYVQCVAPLDMNDGNIQNVRNLYVDNFSSNTASYVFVEADLEANGTGLYGFSTLGLGVGTDATLQMSKGSGDTFLQIASDSGDNCLLTNTNGSISIECNSSLFLISDTGDVDIGASAGGVNIIPNAGVVITSNNNDVDIYAPLGSINLGNTSDTSINFAGQLNTNGNTIYSTSGNSIYVEGDQGVRITADNNDVNIVSDARDIYLQCGSGTLYIQPSETQIDSRLDLLGNALTGVSTFTMASVQQPLIFFGSGTFLTGGNYSISFPVSYSSTAYSVSVTNTSTAGIVPFVGIKSLGSVIVWGTPGLTFDYQIMGY